MDPRAVKARESYERAGKGRHCYPIELDDVELEESLIAHGWLHPEDRDNRNKVMAAWKAARNSADTLIKIRPKSNRLESTPPNSATKAEIGEVNRHDCESSAWRKSERPR